MNERTKTFQNLSINVSYLTKIFGNYTVLYTSVSNLPGFKNEFGYNYSQDGNNRQAIEPAALRNVFVGLFITIGDDTYKN
jgi:hypothetical protein